MSTTTPTTTSANKIAKNTLFLYLRTLATIAIKIFTIKYLWLALGLIDYGVFSLVAGFVFMFTFISGSMTGSIQRYMSMALGKGDPEYTRRVFSTSVRVQLILILCLLILGETAGLWTVNYFLEIPPGKELAANVVYQGTLFGMLLTMITVPYNACLIAHEHMHIFGYYGILEVVLQFGAVLLISILPDYRLIAYSILLVLIGIVMRIIYSVYCHRHFAETRYEKSRDKDLRKGMLNFQKWTFVGMIGFAARDGGIGVVLNRFFDMAILAAKGIASNIYNVINGFASNFTLALNPQITKRYAVGDIDGMVKLVMSGCKYSFILMSFVAVPLIVAAKLVLTVWLDEITSFTVGFVQLMVALAWLESVVNPITTAIQATGKIKGFQIAICCIMLSILPIGWVWLKFTHNPYLIFVTMLLCSAIGIATRVWILHNFVSFRITAFIKKVYLRTLPCMAVAGLVSMLIFPAFPFNLLGLIAFCISSILIMMPLIYFISLDRSEKTFVNDKFKGIANRFCKK